ncbi:hypothetical protein D3C77_645080 [compost metagenome]
MRAPITAVNGSASEMRQVACAACWVVRVITGFALMLIDGSGRLVLGSHSRMSNTPEAVKLVAEAVESLRMRSTPTISSCSRPSSWKGPLRVALRLVCSLSPPSPSVTW